MIFIFLRAFLFVKRLGRKNNLFPYLEFLWINLVLMDLIVDDPEACIQFLGGLGLVTAGSLQSLDDEFTFKIFHGTGQG